MAKATKPLEKATVFPEDIKALVNETSRATLSINPTEEGWGCYFLLQKTKILKPSFNELIEAVHEALLNNRVKKTDAEMATKKKGSDKPYTLKMK